MFGRLGLGLGLGGSVGGDKRLSSVLKGMQYDWSSTDLALAKESTWTDKIQNAALTNINGVSVVGAGTERLYEFGGANFFRDDAGLSFFKDMHKTDGGPTIINTIGIIKQPPSWGSTQGRYISTSQSGEGIEHYRNSANIDFVILQDGNFDDQSIGSIDSGSYNFFFTSLNLSTGVLKYAFDASTFSTTTLVMNDTSAAAAALHIGARGDEQAGRELPDGAGVGTIAFGANYDPTNADLSNVRKFLEEKRHRGLFVI